MKNIFIVLFLAIVIPCLSQEKEPRLYKEKGKFQVEHNGKHFIVNERIITISLKDTKSLPKHINAIRSNKLGYIDVKIPEKHDVSSYIEELKSSDLYETVEYNSYGEYGDFNPNDTDIDDQWHLETINMPEAWDIAKGCASANIIIGILDAGIDWEHEDIGLGTNSYQNIYLNSGEDAWTDVNDPTTGNGIDDDGNGLVDDWKGWNYDDNSNDSRPNINHGTFVAGIIGAKTNNNLGIAGVIGGNNSQGIGMLSYNLGDVPNGAVLDDAIIDAVDAGVSVIQMSLSVPSTTAINSALQYAANNDVVVVCCAMNDNSSVAYPASNSNVIAVGGITSAGARAAFANYGSALDVVAPAVNIYSTIPNDDYDTDSGTSYAAPQVSALAALILSVNPNLTNDEVRDIIESTCSKVGSYSYSTVAGRNNGTWDDEVGYGCVNAFAAVTAVIDQFTVTGPSTVCYSGSTFTASNAPTCSTIDWTTSTNLHIHSGNNTLTPTIRAKYSSSTGNGWVQINYILDGVTTAGPRKNVWVGKPQVYSLMNHLVDINTGMPMYDFCYGTHNEVEAVHPAGDAHITAWDWRVTGGTVYPYGSQYKYATIYPNSYSNFMVEIRAINGCNEWTDWARMYTNVVDCYGYYMVFSPNPTIGETTLSIESTSEEKTFDETTEWELEVYSPSQSLKEKKTKLKGNSTKIQTQGWKEGVYVVRVKYKDEILTGKLVVKK